MPLVKYLDENKLRVLY